MGGAGAVSGADSARAFRPTASQVPLLRNEAGEVLALRQEVGHGQLIALTDRLILCNGYLGKPDNGRFAADLMAMTTAGGRVWFDELHHGAAAGASPETAWMTTPWGFALLLAVVIMFAGLAMRGRAFGPAIPLRARDDRSTAEYAVAVGSLLHRTGARRVTLEALLSATRRAVAQRVGLGADVPTDRLNATTAQRAPAAAADPSRAEPGVIVGTSVYDLQSRSFRVRQGPVFTNILLADEINRAPAKVQAALLESMEERGVSLEGQQLRLPDPFMVLATQNPIEYEGTYPLPEAQQDRFLFKAFMNYPTPEQELEMLRRWDAGIELRDPARAGVEPIFDAAAVAECQAEARKVTVDERLRRYIIELAVATRQAAELVLGASPRAEVLLLLAAKAAAAFEGRDYVTPDDVKGLLRPTFRHRLLLRPEAEVGGQTADSLLDAVIARVTPPRACAGC